MPSNPFFENRQTDQCGCTCCNPNGVIVLLAAQVLMLLAACFSSVALLDCHFVTVDSNHVDPELTQLFLSQFNRTVPVDEDNQERGLGFFFYEGVDGECTWEHLKDLSDSVSSSDFDQRFEDGHNAYMDFLGSDWNAPRGLAVTAAVVSWCFLGWLLIFSCVSHIKCFRWIFGALLVGVLTIFQGSAFSVFNSDICDRYGCELGRSSRFGIAALILAVGAGLLMFFTRDFAGEADGVKVYATASVTEAHPPRLDEVNHSNDDLVGVTEIQEVEVMEDFDESLVDMTQKKSTEP